MLPEDSQKTFLCWLSQHRIFTAVQKRLFSRLQLSILCDSTFSEMQLPAACITATKTLKTTPALPHLSSNFFFVRNNVYDWSFTYFGIYCLL